LSTRQDIFETVGSIAACSFEHLDDSPQVGVCINERGNHPPAPRELFSDAARGERV
jgi:hypothetical protein